MYSIHLQTYSKNAESKRHEPFLKAAREKWLVTYKSTLVRLAAVLLSEIIKLRSMGRHIQSTDKNTPVNQKPHIQQNYLSKIKFK